MRVQLLRLRSLPLLWLRHQARSPGSRQAQSLDICLWARKVTPGFTFTTPGPAGGGGSLASRHSGPPRRHPPGWLGRAATCVLALVGLWLCHRYYDPLGLPNVHRRFLRYPACPLLPVVSAFSAHKGSTRRSHEPFRQGSFDLAVDSHGCHPVLIRAFIDRKR